MKTVSQITPDYCGPAVVEMLLSNVKIKATQKRIAKAGRVLSMIKKHGMRIDQMAKAVKKIAPGMAFWVKNECTTRDLDTISNNFKYPIGVEWQGLFEHEENDVLEDVDSDPGHYSIVIKLDKVHKKITLIDPYLKKRPHQRILSIKNFQRRWWDVNTVKKNGRLRKVKDLHSLFIITPSKISFPEEIGMQRL